MKITCVMIALISSIALMAHSNTRASNRDNSLGNLLIQGEYKQIEDILYTALHNRTKDNDGRSVLHTHLTELTMYSKDATLDVKNCVDMHLNWVKQYPNSHFANASLGITYVHYAWNARTTKSGSLVSKKRWKLFQKRIRLAATYLLKAYELDPTDPAVPIEMITVAIVHPDWAHNRFKMEEWFKIAIDTDPTDLKAYRSKLNFLHPNWGGSYKEQLAFSRDTLQNAPTDSMAPWILTKTHWNIYKANRYPDYFKYPQIWNEMKKTYIELEKRFPKSLKIANWFAKTAYLAGDLETAKVEFSKIGDDWHEDVWKDRVQFENHKEMAFMKIKKKVKAPEKVKSKPIFPDPVFPDPVFTN